MQKTAKIAAGSAAALAILIAGGLAIALPAQAAPTGKSVSVVDSADTDQVEVEDGTDDGETNDDGTEVEDGTDDGETADDGAEVEDGTDDGETDDDGTEDPSDDVNGVEVEDGTQD